MAKIPPRLFQPFEMRGLRVPHRLWVAPMCQYSSDDGLVNDWHVVHLGSFAVGRAGLVMTEATAVAPEGRISPSDAGIWNDAQADAWRRVVDAVHSQGVPIGIQLAHAGRKASTLAPLQGRGYASREEGGWDTVAPSAIAYGELPQPHALSVDEIRLLVADFGRAAARAIAAGFDLIEIHAAHGYLIDEFLSPLSNARDDAYGGDAEGRSRFLVEIVDAVRAAIPGDVPVVVRFSASDWVEGGFGAADTVAVLDAVAGGGVDLASISSGGNDPRQDIPVGPGYQVPLARAVRSAVDMPVGVAGLITSPQQAESILVDGAADVVYAARQFLRESTFALRAAAELGGELEWPWQYRMAKYAGNIP